MGVGFGRAILADAVTLSQLGHTPRRNGNQVRAAHSPDIARSSIEKCIARGRVLQGWRSFTHCAVSQRRQRQHEHQAKRQYETQSRPPLMIATHAPVPHNITVA